MPSGTMRSEFAINGTYGTLIVNGVTISEIQRVEGSIRINRRDLNVAGHLGQRYKMMTHSGEGSMSYVKVTSRWLKEISRPFRESGQTPGIFTLRYLLDDPEALGNEEVVLGGVRFWEVPFGFNVNDIIEESISFTFESMRIIQEITGDPTVAQIAAGFQE